MPFGNGEYLIPISRILSPIFHNMIFPLRAPHFQDAFPLFSWIFSYWVTADFLSSQKLYVTGKAIDYTYSLNSHCRGLPLSTLYYIASPNTQAQQFLYIFPYLELQVLYEMIYFFLVFHRPHIVGMWLVIFPGELIYFYLGIWANAILLRFIPLSHTAELKESQHKVNLTQWSANLPLWPRKLGWWPCTQNDLNK